MKSRLNYLLILFVFSIGACKQAPPPIVEDGIQYFGEKIKADNFVTFDEFVTQVDQKEEVNLKLKAKVESVCQAKGCWMNLVSDSQSDNGVFVKFKDYGFFMPKDISGRYVVVEGKGYKEVTSVDELRHYAEDEGLSKEEIEAITEPKEEIKFMASGVALLE